MIRQASKTPRHTRGVAAFRSSDDSARRWRGTSSRRVATRGISVSAGTPSDAFTRSTLRNRAIKAWRAAGLEPLTPHQARHCCASYLAAAGVDLKEAQEALGRADIRTTLNIYTHATPGWRKRAAAKLDAYFDGDKPEPISATVARQSGSSPVRSGAVPQRSKAAS